MRTHISVSNEIHKKLNNLKASLGLRSVDAVVEHLIALSEHESEHVSADSSNVEGLDEAVRRRRIDVRDPLYSFEILAARRGMLDYYTGFDRPAIELLIRRIGEVCTTLCFVTLLQGVAAHVLPCYLLTLPV